MYVRFDPFHPAVPFLPIDAVRRGDDVVLTADLPGVDPADIDVTVDHHVLTITAERPAPATVEGDRVLAAERTRGRIVRRFTLGQGVDTTAITAQVDRGVLTLHLPVAEAAKPRRIEVGTAPATVEVTSSTPAGVPAQAESAAA